jgi:hypothetical protein
MKWLTAAVVVACLCQGRASALELKNVRSTYGPMGAVRDDAKILPGDFIFMMYDIEGLKVDAKARKASFVTVVELVDKGNKVLFQRETPMELLVTLGGNRVPGDLNVIIPFQQKPGNYKIRLKVEDRNAKQTKTHEYPFEVVEPGFGTIAVTAPAIGVPGQQYVAQFALVNLKLDDKKKPKAEIKLRVLDDKGEDLSLPMVQLLPRDLPSEIDITQQNVVPLPFPIYLNRPGRFVLAIDAEDKLGKRQIKLRIPLTVLDLGQFGGK